MVEEWHNNAGQNLLTWELTVPGLLCVPYLVLSSKRIFTGKQVNWNRILANVAIGTAREQNIPIDKGYNS